jgi:hypothetical protein
MNPFGVRRKDIGPLIGSEQIADEMVHAGWIKPIYSNDLSLAIYATEDIALAFERLRKDGRPKVVRKPRKKSVSADVEQAGQPGESDHAREASGAARPAKRTAKNPRRFITTEDIAAASATTSKPFGAMSAPACTTPRKSATARRPTASIG